MIELTLLSIVT